MLNATAPVSSRLASPRHTMSALEALGRKVFGHFGMPWRDAGGMEIFNIGRDARQLQDAGESWRNLRSLEAVSARAREIEAGQQIPSEILAVARETGFPAEWIAKSNLGANGLAALVSAVRIARELNVNYLQEWGSLTASDVATEVLFDLRQELQDRDAERAQRAIDDQHIASASQAATAVNLSGIVPVELVAEIENVDPTPTPARNECDDTFAALAAELTSAVELDAIDDSDESDLTSTVAPAQRKLSKGARRAVAKAKAAIRRAEAQQPVRAAAPQMVIQACQAQMPVAAVVATVVPQVPARVVGSIGRPGDRIIEDGKTYYLCSSVKGCLSRVPEDQALVSTETWRICRAYNVPTNRHPHPSDLETNHGHPVFCTECAKKVFKKEGDCAKFTQLMAKVAQRTDAQLVANGRMIVQTVLRKSSAAGIPTDALLLIGLWEPGIRERAAEYFADSANLPRPGFVPTMSAQLAIELASGRTYDEWVKVAKTTTTPGVQSAPISTQAQKPVQMEIVSKATGTVETARFGTPDHVFVMPDDADEASAN